MANIGAAAAAESTSARQSSDEPLSSARSFVLDAVEVCEDLDRSSLLSSWSRLEESAATLRKVATPGAKTWRGVDIIQKALEPRRVTLTQSGSNEQYETEQAPVKTMTVGSSSSSQSPAKLADINMSHASLENSNSLKSRGSEDIIGDPGHACTFRSLSSCNSNQIAEKHAGFNLSIPSLSVKESSNAEDNLSGTTGETPIISHRNGVMFTVDQHSGLIRRIRNMEATEEARRSVVADYSKELSYSRADAEGAREELAVARNQLAQLCASVDASSGEVLALKKNIMEQEALIYSLTQELGQLTACSVSERASLRIALSKASSDSLRVRGVCSEWESATTRLREERRLLKHQIAELESEAGQQEWKAAEDVQWWKIRWWQESVRVQEEQDISMMLSPDVKNQATETEEELRKECEQRAAEAHHLRAEVQRLESLCASHTNALTAQQIQSQQVAQNAPNVQNVSRRLQLEYDEEVKLSRQWREETQKLRDISMSMQTEAVTWEEHCSKTEAQCRRDVEDVESMLHQLNVEEMSQMKAKVETLQMELHSAQKDATRHQQKAKLEVEELQAELQIVIEGAAKQRVKANAEVQRAHCLEPSELQLARDELSIMSVARELASREHKAAELQIHNLHKELQKAGEDSTRCMEQEAQNLNAAESQMFAEVYAWEGRCALALEESTLWYEEAENTRAASNTLRTELAVLEGRLARAESIQVCSAGEISETKMELGKLNRELLRFRAESEQKCEQGACMTAEIASLKQNQGDKMEASPNKTLSCELKLAQAETRTWRGRFRDASEEVESCRRKIAHLQACRAGAIEGGAPRQRDEALPDFIACPEAAGTTATAELRQLQTEIAEVAAMWQGLL